MPIVQVVTIYRCHKVSELTICCKYLKHHPFETTSLRYHLPTGTLREAETGPKDVAVLKSLLLAMLQETREFTIPMPVGAEAGLATQQVSKFQEFSPASQDIFTPEAPAEKYFSTSTIIPTHCYRACVPIAPTNKRCIE